MTFHVLPKDSCRRLVSPTVHFSTHVQLSIGVNFHSLSHKSLLFSLGLAFMLTLSAKQKTELLSSPTYSNRNINQEKAPSYKDQQISCEEIKSIELFLEGEITQSKEKKRGKPRNQQSVILVIY